MADGDSERVRGVGWGRQRVECEDRPHHSLNLSLLRTPVAAHRLLHPSRRVLGAVDAGARGCDQHGASRLSDGERDAGVCSHEGLLQRDGGWLVLRNERLDVVEDRPEAELLALPRRRSPPAVID